ncbi:hypothetical protein GBA52_010381 [Prunus armeniaca]|nr:hypothetical protein GBA52_018117 [Prunus armeniaca]KAH0983198.1 hypothetical protein GBA52_010375 [Prunus armeniaca]KAH0983204.1 hypothetical protein GBA52_010381 [Prunus armeniaca]
MARMGSNAKGRHVKARQGKPKPQHAKVRQGKPKPQHAKARQGKASKATLPLTIPYRVFKSSAKDSTRRSVEIVIQGGPRSSSAARASPTTRAFGGLGPLLRVGKRAAGACVASSPDSDLEAFSHNPTHGSFAPLAFQPSAMTNCANQRFLSY